MKQLKPYKELIWEIVKANGKILNARRLDRWYSCIKCNQYSISRLRPQAERNMNSSYGMTIRLYIASMALPKWR